MNTNQVDTNVLNKFLKYLGRNKIGQTFFRYVSTSLEKSHHSIEKSQRRYSNRKSKYPAKNIIKTMPSQNIIKFQANKTVTSFNINENLGQSVRLHQGISHNVQNVVQAIHQRSRQLTFRDRMQVSRLSSFALDINGIETQQFFKKREQLIKTNKIDEILMALTGKTNIGKLRIYKDRLKKFYNFRYARQKLTSFFDYEYIEDYDSQLGYLETLLSLTLQEIHFLCFITMDINSDGLLCNDDLFNFATVSSEANALVNKDIYRMFHYISMYQNPRTNISIMDHVAEDDPVKDPLVTIQKYRLTILKTNQQNLMSESETDPNSSAKKSIKLAFKSDNKGVIVTRKVKKHMFSLKAQEQQGQAAIKQLRKRFAQYHLQSRSFYRFKINFQRYQNIFKNCIPQTYFDLLYMQGGIELQGKKYCSWNFDFDQVEKKDAVKIDFDRYKYYKNTVGKMRETFRKSRIEKFNDSQFRNKST